MVAPLYRVVFSRRAFTDLNSILDYVEQRSRQGAMRLLDRLWDSAHRLRDFPHRYPVFPNHPRIRQETRVMPVGSYLIFYRIIEPQGLVRVVRIRHGARRPPRQV